MVDYTNPEKIMSRFWKFTKKTNSCWIWTGGLNKDGYGVFSVRSKSVRAHKFIYEKMVVNVPQGLVLDHLCRNHSCVNPDHLEIVTQKENLHRGIGFAAVNTKKTHCPQGHEYTQENCSGFKNQGRQCVECVRMHNRNAYRKKHPNYRRCKSL